MKAVPREARTRGHGFEARVEGGSFGKGRGHAKAGHVGERGDLLIAVTGSGTDGYRQQSGAFKVRLNANYGYRLSDAAETRFYLTLNHRSEEHTSELQSLMRISYAVFCLKKKKKQKKRQKKKDKHHNQIKNHKITHNKNTFSSHHTTDTQKII